MWYKTEKRSRTIPKNNLDCLLLTEAERRDRALGCEWKWMALWGICQGRAPGETCAEEEEEEKRNIRIAARILVEATVQGGVDMQQIHPRPPSRRRRWLHCGFPVKSSRIRHRCSSPICVTSGPAYSHIWRVHIWPMCIWRHKCHSFWTTCPSLGPAKEFRIHWSFSSPPPSPWPRHPHHLSSSVPPASHLILIPLLWNLFQKMGCLGNTKTEDQRNEEKVQRENNKKINKQLQKDKQIYRATHRLLLLGGCCVI